MKTLNALGILSSDVATGWLIWIDGVNGNDALGRRGQMTTPFKSLTAAKSAAEAGDTIMVLPGLYKDQNHTSGQHHVEGRHH